MRKQRFTESVRDYLHSQLVTDYINRFTDATWVRRFNIRKEKRDIRDSLIAGGLFLLITTIISYFNRMFDKSYFWLFLLGLLIYGVVFVSIYFIVAGSKIEGRKFLLNICVLLYLFGGLTSVNVIRFNGNGILNTLMYCYFGAFSLLLFQIIARMKVWVMSKQLLESGGSGPASREPSL